MAFKKRKAQISDAISEVGMATAGVVTSLLWIKLKFAQASVIGRQATISVPIPPFRPPPGWRS